jgi:hypothetical protein
MIPEDIPLNSTENVQCNFVHFDLPPYHFPVASWLSWKSARSGIPSQRGAVRRFGKEATVMFVCSPTDSRFLVSLCQTRVLCYCCQRRSRQGSGQSGCFCVGRYCGKCLLCMKHCTCHKSKEKSQCTASSRSVNGAKVFGLSSF